MEIFIVLIIGLFFGWLANIFIEGHGLGYAMDLLVATLGALFGLIIFKNISLPTHSFFGLISACVLGTLTFLFPVVVYSTKRKTL